MTTEEIIHIYEKSQLTSEYFTKDALMGVYVAGLAALYGQKAQTSNEALTLDDLRQMDGEPVWVVEIDDYPPHWGLVYWCRKNKRNIVYVTINNGASICAEAFMAAGGKIYRCKPEEGNQ